MSKSFKIILGLAILSAAGACANRQSEEVVYSEPAAPIVAEPTYSKY